MQALNFDTGRVSFSINDDYEVSFNPTDSNFTEKLYAAFELLDSKQTAYEEQVKKMSNKKEIFTIAKQRDVEMRELIDNIFDAPVSENIFGSMNVYAMANGLPVWCNFLMAVMDEIDTTFSREQKATNPRIKHYNDRYSKYMKQK